MIDPSELKIEVWPPRQKGGQHVTLTRSGVKITHIPTGIEASCEYARSQRDNRVIAMDMILAALTHPKLR